jgi:hypothetical protein
MGSLHVSQAPHPALSFQMSILFLAVFCLLTGCGDVVADVPEVFVEPMLHTLLQDLDWCAHGSDDSTADDAFRQFEMVETEQLHALVEIDEAFGDVVKAKEFFVTAIEVVERDSCALELVVKTLAETRADVEKRKESRGIETAAVAESAADDVVVVGRDGLENVQKADARLNELVGAADEARAVGEIGAFKMFECAAKFEGRSL